MRFVTRLQKSMYSPQFYATIPNESVSIAFRYFFTLALCLAFIGAIWSLIVIVPSLNAFLRETPNLITKYYPAELVITITKGAITANVQEPYRIALPNELHNNSTLRDVSNLVVIDTKTPFSVDQFRKDSALFLVTKDAIVSRSDNSQFRIMPADRLPDTTVSRDYLLNALQKLQPYAKFLPPLVVLAVFFGIFLITQSTLLYLIIAAPLVMLIAKIYKTRLSYPQSYRVALHAVTIPLLIRTAFWMFTTPEPISFLFTIIFLLAVAINLRPIKQSTTITQQPTA